VPKSKLNARIVFMQRVYKNYMLILLMVILAFNFADRLALGIVLQDIKVAFELTDTQLGFLGGIAFALFYSIMGIPIARWADRGNRVLIIGVTTALWSLAVALCGAASSFTQLLLTRVLVGIGEAGCIPPANSLIADYFIRAERARAVGIYTMGIQVSLVFGVVAAGWANQFYGWRATFVLFGAPGLLLALVAAVTLKEPRRMKQSECTEGARGEVASIVAAPGASLREDFTALWAIATFRHMLLCFVVGSFLIYGSLQWQTPFFIRSYGMQTRAIGTWLGMTVGLCGLAGNYLGGVLASRFAPNNECLQLRAIAFMYCWYGCFSACVYLVPNQHVAFGCLGAAAVCISATNGPFLAIIQTLVPPQRRAVATAILLLFANLIGLGLGPLAAGALSDALHPGFGEESLRYALLALCPWFSWCAWHAYRASQTVALDVHLGEFAHAPARLDEQLCGAGKS
jgi:MFS transporter, Spinster family, sphingosine-1-phosphate transporter